MSIIEKSVELDFEIDKLTNSIENAITGEVFDTSVVLLQKADNKQIKKTKWLFDWHKELKDSERQVYKLTTVNNPNVIHGLISITDKGDHIFMDLIETAKFNKGKEKLYRGVAGNLVSYACKMAFEKGYSGIVSFVAKTALISHYEKTLGAQVFAGDRMFIDTKEAYLLVKQYYKNFKL
jgi:hypothetical protein